MKYIVEGSYNVPEWFDLDITADTEDEAKAEAIKNIEMSFPEAIDVEVTGVKVND